MNWIFVTASFGEARFHDSAKRLLSQAKRMGIFDDFIHVTDSNLDEYAPRVFELYASSLNSKTIGYGFYTWKPEIVLTLLERNFGSGVMYVDAGCEMNSKWFARLRLRLMTLNTRNGGFFHKLNYPESYYTKKYVLDYFSLKESQKNSTQIQATWFLLSGEKGRRIAQNWVDACLSSLRLVDDSIDSENDEFIENRYDQSVLSCLLKVSGIKPKTHVPCYRPITLGSKIRCYFHPVWSSRNRSGVSIQGLKGM